MPQKKSTKAPARGRRKSIVDQYKAKARGKKTSPKNEKEKKAVKRVPMPNPTADRLLEMTVGNEAYTAGDVAYYIMEAQQFSKRVHTGEIKYCHPLDSIAPCVTVWDHYFGNYRTIRASLIGWSKVEAKQKWQDFLKDNPDTKV
jgi:hypothetical protein